MTTRRVRTNGRQRKCAYCDRSFTKEEHLRRHQRSHTGEKPFKCHECDKSYARSDVLFRHLQTHISAKGDRELARHNENQNRDGRTRSMSDVIIGDDNTLTVDQEIPTAHVEHQPDASPTAHLQAISHQSPSLQLLLPSISSPIPDGFFQTPAPQGHDMDDMVLDSDKSNVAENELQTDLNESIFGSANEIQNPDQISPENATNLTDAAESSDTHTNARHSPDNRPFSARASLLQTINNEATGTLQDKEGYQVDNGKDQSSFDILQSLDLQLDDQLLSPFQLGETNHAFRFLDQAKEPPLLGTENIPALDYLPFNHNMIDYLDWNVDNSVFNTTTQVLGGRTEPMPGESMQKIHRLWSRQRPKFSERLSRRLWKAVIHHGADNIFTTLHSSTPELEGDRQASRYTINEDCRDRLIQYCKILDNSYQSKDTVDDEARSISESSPRSSIDGFETVLPSLEILDSSLDFFFQFFHPTLPFIHKSTFDARKTTNSLLFAMCLVGMSYLDRTRTKSFVIRYLKRMMQACLYDMTSQALGECEPSELLTALASSLIISYLALGFRDEIDDCQAYMLCVQMLNIADKLGIFAGHQGDDPVSQFRQPPSDPAIFWKGWARVESVKRLICCFVWLDMAYARLLNTAGAIEIDRLELHLPCEDPLFDCSTSESFLFALQRGAQLSMPQVNIRNFDIGSTPSLNDVSVQVLLRALYLKVLSVRTNILRGNDDCSKSHTFNYVEALATDSSIKGIIASVLSLPITHASFLKSANRMNALGWNYLCITLTADVELLEVASGRDGPEATSAALMQVSKWAMTANARRSVLHAAQIFDILDSSRIRESHLTRPDLVLFASALVISQYVLASASDNPGPNSPPFELMQNIDWAMIKNEGFVGTSKHIDGNSPMLQERHLDSTNAALRFLRYGGPISFAGELQHSGGVSARKIVRKFAHLMDGFGTWDGSCYSQLLKIMCDCIFEDRDTTHDPSHPIR